MVLSARDDSAMGEATDTPLLRLRLLGGFQAEVAGEVIPDPAWQRRTARTLIKVLATEPGRRLHREQLLDILWPDLAPRAAVSRLRQAVHLVRRALGEAASCLLVEDDILSLDARTTWIDADHFEALASAAQRAGGIGAHEAALAAYGGELLPEDRYEEWTLARREELARRHLDLLLDLAELLEREGDRAAAADHLRHALTIDPLREDVHRRLMRLYASGGSRHQALRQYQACRDMLQRELGVSPEPETEELYSEILAGTAGASSSGSEALEAAPLPRAIRQPPLTHLVGRDRILVLLADSLRRVLQGTGGMVLLGGEAGVGKTRLAAEVAREAHRAGATVLWGGSYEREGQLPYGTFVEALDEYMARLSSTERRTAAGQYPELARLLPSLIGEVEAGHAVATHPASPEGERARLFAAMVRMLADLAARPVLLVLDDLHCADVASLQLLHHLARAAADHRWLILGTYREEDVEAGSDFQRLCAVATREGLCQRIDLLRLARQDSDRLAKLLLDSGEAERPLLDRLYALSLGNPLFIQEMVRLMQEQGDLTVRDGGRPARPEGQAREAWLGGSAPVPQQVRDLMESRLHRMGEDVRRVLALAAVAGMDCSFALLRAATDLSERQLLDALDRALETRVLEERGDAYAFRHPLLRAAIYERLSRSRRTYLHGVLAETMEQLQAPGYEGRREEVEALAYHYAHSTNLAKAVHYLERAGDRARSLYASKIAETYYRELLERLTESGAASGDLLARASEKLGGVLITLARYDEALEALERAAEGYRATGDLAGLTRATAQIGRAHGLRGTAEEGIRRIEPLLPLLTESAGAHELGVLYAVLAYLFFASGRYRQSLESAERSMDLARSLGNDTLLVEAQQWYGTALSLVGRVEEGLRSLEQVIPLAETVGDLTTLSRALNNAAQIYEFGGQADRSRLYYRRGLEVAEKLGDPARIAFMTHRVGVGAFLAGNWSEARASMERALALLREIPRSWFAPYTHVGLAALLLAEGDGQAAADHLEQALTLAQPSGDVQAVRAAQAVWAEMDLLEGRAQEACARLDPLLYLPGVEEDEATALLPVAAWAHLEMGDEARAEELLAKAVKQATAENDRITLSSALRVRGMLAARQARWDASEMSLDQALALAREIGYPYAEGRVLQTYGELYVKTGDRERARQRFQEALAIFQRVGAKADVEHTSRMLLQLDSE